MESSLLQRGQSMVSTSTCKSGMSHGMTLILQLYHCMTLILLRIILLQFLYDMN